LVICAFYFLFRRLALTVDELRDVEIRAIEGNGDVLEVGSGEL